MWWCGLGKTHLLNAIGLEFKMTIMLCLFQQNDLCIILLKSIKKNDMVNFKDFFRKSSVFIIDDIQFISGKKAFKKSFFTHLIV